MEVLWKYRTSIFLCKCAILITLKTKENVMKQGILFFDIDGTILTEDGTRRIPESTRRGIQEAKGKGHLLFVNTGRVYLNIEPLIRDLGFDGYVCGCGTNIYYHGKELFHNQLPQTLCRETVAITRQCHMATLFEASDVNAFDHSMEGNRKYRELIRYFSESGRAMLDVEDPDFHFDKFTGWFPLEQDMQVFYSFIKGQFDYIDRGRDGKYGMCEIVPCGYSKGTGIRYLLDYFGLPLENSYAFGDSTNDLPMLTYAAHAVAMGGSAAVVQEAVEYVTDGIEEDGLYHAMQHYGLV